MEPISAGLGIGIGVASLASIFQTCLHGYRTLNTAMEIGNTAVTLNVQFRVEELRLYLWGRSWGLVIELDSMKNPPATSTIDNSEPEEKSDTEVQTSISMLSTVDEEFEIPGLRDLTMQVLGRIHDALQEWKMVGERYSTGSTKVAIDQLYQDIPATSLKAVIAQQDAKTQVISSRTKISSKLRWALTDKSTMDKLLSKLTSLNDALEKLLPKREKTSLARGLASELLVLLEGGRSGGTDLAQKIVPLESAEETKAASIMILRAKNMTEQGERKAQAETSDKPSPFASSSQWQNGEKEDMRIPASHFSKLDDPKIEYYQQQDERGRWISSRYVPLPKSIAVLTLPNAPTSVEGLEAESQATLIEWRPAAHESRASELTNEDLKERRDHIARLLHQTSVLDADFRILDCLGYTSETEAHSPDGSVHQLVGYVYKFPEFASTRKLPVTLRELLGEAYKSDTPKVPPLEDRLRLARDISIALYQLQCAGWVHRKVSSYNIMFFYSHKTGELDLSHPYLGGWQYARPDDQRHLYPSERESGGVGDLDMYVHRYRLFGRMENFFPRFRKSFDIYSLGIVLIEVAFWEPIMSLATEKQQKQMERFDDVASGAAAEDWWKSIYKVATEELAAEMGNAYKDAVLFCLEGPGKGNEDKWKAWKEELRQKQTERNPRDAYIEDDDFGEVGIEKEFYWNVVKPLERIQIR